MSSSSETENQQNGPLQKLGTTEFVVMMASLMSITALSIDTMLPALPHIAEELHITDPNDRQMIITIFMIGLGIGSLIYGPVSDRFGRRPVLMVAAALQLLSTFICVIAPSFDILLIARLLAGLSIASGRVVAISIVRDCFRGDAMARIMSLVMVTFIIVPVFAPTLGSIVLLVAPWRGIFALLLLFIILLGAWQYFRLPETLPPENRVAIGPRDLWATFLEVVTNRNSIGHMLASGVTMGGLIGFVVSIQQIFFDVFDAGEFFPVGFALITMWMGIGSLLNSRLVERIGARRLSQGAVIMLIAVSLIHSLLIVAGYEHLVLFIVIQAITTTCFSFSGANFSAISLEPFKRGAGLASSIQAALTIILSAALGGLVGASFDGTVLPMSLGFLAFGVLAFLIIAWAERWRLFARPGHASLRKGNYV